MGKNKSAPKPNHRNSTELSAFRAAFRQNLNALSATLKKLKKAQVELHAEVQNIERDARTALLQYEAGERKARGEKAT